MFLHLKKHNLYQRSHNEDASACQCLGGANEREYPIDDISADQGGDQDHCPFGKKPDQNGAQYAPDNEGQYGNRKAVGRVELAENVSTDKKPANVVPRAFIEAGEDRCNDGQAENECTVRP